MTIPSYSTLHTTFITENPCTNDFPKETAYSIPVCLKRTDGIYDAFFIYSYPPRRGDRDPTRPFAWIALACDGRPNMALNWCSVVDFVPTSMYPLDSKVSARLSSSMPPARQREAYAKAIEAYEKIRLFAFHHDTTVAQLQIIATYKKVFSEIVPEGLYPFYYALSPDFFDWMRLPLPKNALSQPPVSKEAEILEEVRGITQLLEREHKRIGEKDRLVSDMHDELQQHRNDLLSSLTHPLERDVIMIIDTIQKNLVAFQAESHTPENYQKLHTFYAGVKQDLTDLLYRQGVDPYTVNGNAITLPRQKVIVTTETHDASLDKTIAKRIAVGWEKSDKVVRPEYVSAYLYSPDLLAPNSATRETDQTDERTTDNREGDVTIE